MVRKIAALLLVLLLAGSGTALALEGATGSTFSPGDAFYDAFIDLKTSQYELTEDLLEKALLLSEFADQLVEAIISESDLDYLEELLEQLNLTEADIAELIAAYYDGSNPPDGGDSEGEDPDSEDPDEEDPDEEDFDCSQRGRRLREKVADLSLPEHVRANAQKALDNQARAMEHHAWAKSGQQGPPPWSNSKHNRHIEEDDDTEGNGDTGDLENGQPEEEGGNIQTAVGQPENNKKAENNNGKGHGRENAPGQQKKK